MFQIRRMCFSNRLTIHRVIIEVWHSFVIRDWYRATATFRNFFYVSHGSATRLLRNGEKYYTYFVDNSLLFPTVNKFSKSVNSWWSYCEQLDTTFFETHCKCTKMRLLPGIMYSGRLTSYLAWSSFQITSTWRTAWKLWSKQIFVQCCYTGWGVIRCCAHRIESAVHYCRVFLFKRRLFKSFVLPMRRSV